MPRKKIQDDQNQTTSTKKDDWNDVNLNLDLNNIAEIENNKVNIDIDSLKIESIDEIKTEEKVSDLGNILIDETLNNLEVKEEKNENSFEFSIEEVKSEDSTETNSASNLEINLWQEEHISNEETISQPVVEEQNFSFSLDESEVVAETTKEEDKQILNDENIETETVKSEEENAFNIWNIFEENNDEQPAPTTPVSTIDMNVETTKENNINQDNSSSFSLDLDSVNTEETKKEEISKEDTQSNSMTFELGDLNKEEVSVSNSVDVQTNNETPTSWWFTLDLNETSAIEEISKNTEATSKQSQEIDDFLKGKTEETMISTPKVEDLSTQSVSTTDVQSQLTNIQTTITPKKKKSSIWSLFRIFWLIIGLVVLWWAGLLVHDVMYPDTKLMGDIPMIWSILGGEEAEETVKPVVKKTPKKVLTWSNATVKTWNNITWTNDLTTKPTTNISTGDNSTATWSDSIGSWETQSNITTGNSVTIVSTWNTENESWSVTTGSDNQLLAKINTIQTKAKKAFFKAKNAKNEMSMKYALKAYKDSKSLMTSVENWEETNPEEVENKLTIIEKYISKSESLLENSDSTTEGSSN